MLASGVFWLAAGRWDLPFAWAYWALWAGSFVTNAVLGIISCKFAALLKERENPGAASLDNVRLLRMFGGSSLALTIV
jgi:hypothetical protein